MHLSACILIATDELLMMLCRKKIMEYRHQKQQLDACQRLQESQEAKEVTHPEQLKTPLAVQ